MSWKNLVGLKEVCQKKLAIKPKAKAPLSRKNNGTKGGQNGSRVFGNNKNPSLSRKKLEKFKKKKAENEIKSPKIHAPPLLGARKKNRGGPGQEGEMKA